MFECTDMNTYKSVNSNVYCWCLSAQTWTTTRQLTLMCTVDVWVHRHEQLQDS